MSLRLPVPLGWTMLVMATSAGVAGCLGTGGVDDAGIEGAMALAPGRYESIHTTVASFDGTHVAITIFRPMGASSEHPVPVLLHSHGGGGLRCDNIPCRDFRGFVDFDLTPFAEAGFGLVSMDQRGYGGTGGSGTFMAPDVEARDVMAVVDHIATLDWVVLDAPGDPRLGGLGVSYGGAAQLITALEETRLTGRTRFDALAPEITWHDFPATFAPSGVPRSAWSAALLPLMAPHQPEFANRLAVAVATGEPTFAQYHRHSPAWYAANGVRLDIPVFLAVGVPDTVFPLNEAWHNHVEVLAPEAREASILLAHRTGHVLRTAGAGAQGEGDLAVLQGPCDETAFVDNRAHEVAWYRRHLVGDDVELGKNVQLRTFEGRCIQLETLPEANASYDIAPATAAGTPIPAAAGARVALRVADGPLTVAGIPRLALNLTGAGPDVRLFWSLGVGNDPGTLRVAGDQWMPMRTPASVAVEDFELAGIVEDVPDGQALWLVVAPWVDQFATSGSRMPGAVMATDVRVALPVVDGAGAA